MANSFIEDVLIRFGFDTQANVTYVGDKSLLTNYRPLSGMKVNGLGGDVCVSGAGTLRVTSRLSNGASFTWVLHNVLYIENCDCNIIAGHDFIDNVPEADQKGDCQRLSASSAENRSKASRVPRTGEAQPN